MIIFSESAIQLGKHASLACFARSYVLCRGGLLKTCGHDEAITLLKTGKWYDITQYELNEEVLTYEKQNDSSQPSTSSEWQEPKHEQRECVTEHGERKELDSTTSGSRSTNSEVKKKRGRPKAIK